MGNQKLQITQTKPLHSLLILGSAILTLVAAILVVALGTSTHITVDADLKGSLGFYSFEQTNTGYDVNINAAGWITLVLAVVAIIPLVFYSSLSKKINEIQVGSVLLALVSVVIIVALVNNDLTKTIYKAGDGVDPVLNGTGWAAFVIAIFGIVASVAAIGLSSYSLVKNYKKGPASSKKASAK